MQQRFTLYLHDVLYALEIQRNLISVISMMGLGLACTLRVYILVFIWIILFYSRGLILNGFMVLDLDNSSFNVVLFLKLHLIVMIIL